MSNFMSGKKTYVGILIVLIPVISKMFGYDVSEAFPVDFASLAEEAVILVGAALAFYGRAKAKTPGMFVKSKR